MVKSVSREGFQIVQPTDGLGDYQAAQAASTQRIQRAASAGEYAQSVAPVLLIHALAIATLNYFRVFTMLSFLNCRLTTYAVPAAASYAANALADQVQPVMNAVGTVAGFATRNLVECATTTNYDRYMAAVAG